MYLHLGQETVVPMRDVLGIFDLENTTVSSRATRDFLASAEKKGYVVTIGEELPKSFTVCQEKNGKVTVYLSQISCATLLKRAKALCGI